MNELDTARLDHIKRYPELILEVTPWETYSVCGTCSSVIPTHHRCLVGHSMDVYYDSDVVKLLPHYRTPCCGKASTRSVRNGNYTSIDAVPHKRMRKRMIITNYVRKGVWPFRYKIPAGLWEEEEV